MEQLNAVLPTYPRALSFLVVTTLVVTGCSGSGGGSDGEPVPDPLLLSDIDAGVGGFLIKGVAGDHYVASDLDGGGDVNGDGLGDVLVSSSSFPGEAFLVFGKSDTTPVLTTDLDGLTGGFTIVSDDQEGYLYQVAIAGDVNGDGLDDIVVGTPLRDTVSANMVGAAYVIFGKTSTTPVDVADVAAGIGGFMIYGTDENEEVGWDVAGAGDVNGDGLDDVAISNHAANFGPRGTYIIFGKTTTEMLGTPDLRDGIGGFAILGQVSLMASLGYTVSGAGDVNGDGLDDIILGDEHYDGTGGTKRGAAIIVFGKTTGDALGVDDVMDGNGGFAILGTTDEARAGRWVSGAGDVNGDGLGDVLLGAPLFETVGMGSVVFPGAAYVIFGKPSADPVLLSDVEQGQFGIYITGSVGTNHMTVVGTAGDLNNDGLDDLLVGASNQRLMDGLGVGTTYVIFGLPSPGVIDVRDVAARQGGYAFAPPSDVDISGGAISGADDINGDGRRDIVIGSSREGSIFGEAYVVFLPPADSL